MAGLTFKDAPDKSRDRPNRSSISAQKRGSKAESGTFVVGVFKGKSFVQNHHLLVKYHQLIPRKDKSLTDKVSLRDNLIIHGDNLKALKALLPMYGGKIKCIYIDPPYNTGNENWVYNDNVNSPMVYE